MRAMCYTNAAGLPRIHAILAAALDQMLTGASDTALNVYSESRRPIAMQLVRLTDRLTRLATVPRAMRPARNAAIGVAGHVPAAQHALAWRLSGLVYR